MALNNEIRTRLFPIDGLTFSPKTPDGDVVLGPDVGMVIGLMVGRSPGGTSLLSLSDDGSLKVSITGAGLTAYTYNAGTTQDDYETVNTIDFGSVQSHFTLLAQDADLKAQLKNPSGQWGAEFTLQDGATWDFDLQILGCRVKSAAASTPAKWELVTLS